MDPLPEYVPRVGAGVRVEMDGDQSVMGRRTITGTFIEFRKSEADDYLLIVEPEKPLRIPLQLRAHRLIALRVAGTGKTKSHHGHVYGIRPRRFSQTESIPSSALRWLGRADFEFD